MYGYRFIGKGRLGRWGRSVALCAIEQLKCMELCCGTSDGPRACWLGLEGRPT